MTLRILYAGPGLSGRTTTIKQICKLVPRGLHASADPIEGLKHWTMEATFLRHGAGPLTLSLFATGESLWYSPEREEAARVADALVFVVDSQFPRLDASRENIDRTTEYFLKAGRDISRVPVALQYNKRDLTEIASVQDLERVINIEGWPSFESIASRGQGVLAPLSRVVEKLSGVGLVIRPG
jgi:mutual gliding-motility protein MglA